MTTAGYVRAAKNCKQGWYPRDRHVTPWSIVLLQRAEGIPCRLWYQNFHYRVHKRPPLDPILSKLNQVNNFQCCFSDIYVNIILPSTPRSSEWSLPSFLRILHVPLTPSSLI
jgi:hypothetical protein